MPATISGAHGAVAIDGVAQFTVSHDSTNAEFSFQSEGGSPEVPPGLEEFVSITDRNRIVLRIPLKLEPAISVNLNGFKVTWKASGKVTNSVFDVSEPPTYPLGPADELLVEVYGLESMKKEVTVDPNGFITLPLLDKVKVQGLTLNDLQGLLEKEFSEYIKNPEINVQLKEYGSRFVTIIGEVAHPVRIPLKRTLRLLDAVSEAGGFAEKSGDIEIQRKDQEGAIHKLTISKDSLLGSGHGKENIYLFDRDTVNVIPVNSIYISGEVANPKAVPFTKDLTLLRAIALSGGFTQWANKDKVTILRKGAAGGNQTLKVDAEKIEKGKEADVPLLPDDQIIVYERKLF